MHRYCTRYQAEEQVSAKERNHHSTASGVPVAAVLRVSYLDGGGRQPKVQVITAGVTHHEEMASWKLTAANDCSRQTRWGVKTRRTLAFAHRCIDQQKAERCIGDCSVSEQALHNGGLPETGHTGSTRCQPERLSQQAPECTAK
jgi:hypothetical protein